ncbi:hypothetical protein B0H15DRAFT_1025924 [Mycena belliarum]|uniref:F-box domain-containing protein n=1 Tax=Mycena belliarum TaxID=1033014 RepID=A0AAD6TW25_9AGAR|nr:hypothetical protein B0H15DRAFT_1025924 [Mycena belliae]
MTSCVQCAQDHSQRQDRSQPFSNSTRRTYLRNRMAELDASIAALSAERRSLQEESDSIIYPILSLPTEITIEVFLRCAASNRLPSPSPSEAPLLLAQICSRWRQLVLDTPVLWRSLLFHGDSSSAELLELWLSRSGSMPLDYTLYCSEPSRAGALIEASILHSHRWQNISLGLPLTSYPALDGLPLPVLRAIRVQLHHVASNVNEVVRDPIIIPHAPLLRTAHISSLPLLKVYVPLWNLTTLQLSSDVELAKCVEILENCPELVHLDVHTTGSADVLSPLIIEHLESLAFNLGEAHILQHLTLPRLRRLTAAGQMVASHVSHLDSFVRRSACILDFLSVHEAHEPGALHAWLRAASPSSSVAELELVRCAAWYTSGDMPSILLAPDVLPGLKRLRISGYQPSHLDHNRLIDILRARRKGASGWAVLESVAIDLVSRGSRGMPRSSMRASLRALAAEGLDIKFTTTDRSVTTHVIIDSRV